MGIGPNNSGRNVPSQVDTLLVRTGMARCELALRSGVSTYCLDNPASLRYLGPTDPTRAQGNWMLACLG